MNTIKYDPTSGEIIGFVSGIAQVAQEEGAVLYSTKGMSDLAGYVVLDDALVERLSHEYVSSGKASVVDKTLFWKNHRNKLLAESDFMLLPDVGDSAYQTAARIYRQKLRDLPRLDHWPDLAMTDIPAKPSLNAIQVAVL